jgi:hypothetical protein
VAQKISKSRPVSIRGGISVFNRESRLLESEPMKEQVVLIQDSNKLLLIESDMLCSIQTSTVPLNFERYQPSDGRQSGSYSIFLE